MAERLIGEAYISILPEGAGFRAKVDSIVNTTIRSIKPEIPVGADTKRAVGEVEAFKKLIQQMRPTIEPGIGVVAFQADKEVILKGLQEIQKRASSILLTGDDTQLASKIFKLRGEASDLANKLDELNCNINSDKAMAQLYSLRSQLEDLQDKSSHLDIDFDEKAATTHLATLQAYLEKLHAEADSISVDADDKQALAAFAALNVRAQKLRHELNNIPISADMAPIEAKILALDAAFSKLGGKNAGPVTPGVDNQGLVAAEMAAVKLASDLEKLSEVSRKLALPDSAAKAFATALEEVRVQAEQVNNHPIATAGDIAAVSGLSAKVNTLKTSVSGLATAEVASAAATKTTAGSWFSLGGIANNIAKVHIPEFAAALHEGTAAGESLAGSLGGPLITAFMQLQPPMIRTASGVHMVLEAAIELSAVWAPAIIAMTAFGIAAAPIAMKVATQVKNMYTVVQATGQQFKYLGTQASSLEDKIKPAVYTAMGTALEALQGKSGTLGSTLAVVGRVVDRMVTSFVMWFRSLNGNGSLMKNGARDAEKLAEAFAALGSIIHTFLQATPGIAEVLLNIGTGFLQVTASVMKVLEPVLKVFLLFHGIEFYVGTAVTLLAVLASKFKLVAQAFMDTGAISTGTKAIEAAGTASAAAAVEAEASGGKWQYFGTAMGNLTNVFKDTFTLFKAGEGPLEKLGAGLGVAAKEGGGLERTGSGLLGLVNPWVLGIAAVAAVTFLLVKYLGEEKDAQQRVYEQTEKAISQATSFAAAQAATYKGIAQMTVVLQGYDTKLRSMGGSTTTSVKALKDLSGAAGNGASPMQVFAQKAQDAKNSIVELDNQAATQAVRWDVITKAYGGASAAMTLIHESGVKVGDLLGDNTKKAQAAALQLQGTAEAYGLMGTQAGTAGMHLDALNLAQSQTLTATQKLTSAEQQFVSSITAGDTNLQAYLSGMGTLKDSLDKGSAAGVKYTTSAGKLTEKQIVLKSALNGTTTSALANRQAFASNVNAAETLYTSLQTMAAEAGNGSKQINQLSTAGRAMVAQLVPMAKGSKSAQAEVYALAQTAGYTGNNSLAAMTKWAGNATGASKRLDGATTGLQESAAGLNSDLKKVDQSLQSYSNSALINAIAQTTHLKSSINGLVSSFINSHRTINGEVLGDAVQLYNKYIKAGMGAGQAKGQVDQLMKSLGASNSQIARVNVSLDANAHKSDGLRSAMVKLANDGVGVTKNQMQQLWATANAQKLDALANKAGTTRAQFTKLAINGLGMTRQAAIDLWNEFNQQKLDMLALKTDNTKNSFIKFAENGLGLTKKNANDLWGVFRAQQLDMLSGKAGRTKTQFEQLTGKLGLSRKAADDLWASLKKLPNTKNIVVNEKITGGGKISISAGAYNAAMKTGVLTSSGAKQQAASNSLLSGHARGGVIPGTSSSVTHDNHIVSVKSGELIIPSQHAAKYGAMAKRDGIPGFAAGGVVGGTQAVSMNNNLMPNTQNTANKVIMEATQSLVSSFMSAQAAAGGGAMSVPAKSGSAAAAQAYARSQLGRFGWGAGQMPALIALWNQESGWNANAVNPGSGAYGIPQALGHGHPYNLGDYANQIQWGLNYIKQRYGSPMAAEAHELSNHWYENGTRAAAKGMALVGERGPELVNFGGGEKVYNAQQTRNFANNSPYSYAASAVQNGNPVQNSGSDMITQQLLIENNKLLAQQNKLIQAQPQNFGRALNGNVSRGMYR